MRWYALHCSAMHFVHLLQCVFKPIYFTYWFCYTLQHTVICCRVSKCAVQKCIIFFCQCMPMQHDGVNWSHNTQEQLASSLIGTALAKAASAAGVNEPLNCVKIPLLQMGTLEHVTSAWLWWCCLNLNSSPFVAVMLWSVPQPLSYDSANTVEYDPNRDL